MDPPLLSPLELLLFPDPVAPVPATEGEPPSSTSMSAAKLEIFSEAATEAARLLDFLDLPGVSQALAMRARERLASSMDSCGEGWRAKGAEGAEGAFVAALRDPTA